MAKWQKWYITSSPDRPTKKTIEKSFGKGFKGGIKRTDAGKSSGIQFWRWKVWR